MRSVRTGSSKNHVDSHRCGKTVAHRNGLPVQIGVSCQAGRIIHQNHAQAGRVQRTTGVGVKHKKNHISYTRADKQEENHIFKHGQTNKFFSLSSGRTNTRVEIQILNLDFSEGGWWEKISLFINKFRFAFFRDQSCSRTG